MSATPVRATFAGLSLRNYVPSEGLSQESLAFSADVYDEEARERIGVLLNDGHGGVDRFTPESAEGSARWRRANEEFVPVPWTGGRQAGEKTWGLADSLSILSASMLAVMHDTPIGSARVAIGSPRYLAGCSEMTLATVVGPTSAPSKWRNAAECADEHGVVTFGLPLPDTGGIEVFVVGEPTGEPASL